MSTDHEVMPHPALSLLHEETTMEAVIIEFTRAEDDAYDRTMCLRFMFRETCIAQKSVRLRRDVRFGQALLELDRLLLSWLHPSVQDDSHLQDLLDSTERLLGEPF